MIDSIRRSVLYVPGDSYPMIQKAAGIPADTLMLNLEDGVAASKKNQARNNIVQALSEIDFSGYEVVIRVNSLDGDMGKRDLNAVVPRKPDGICLPKVEKKEEILAADRAVGEIEGISEIPVGTLRLHAMIESASGVLHAAEIAAASPRMASLIFGSADYANDTRCRPGKDRMEFLLALQMLVLASRAAGIEAIDAPCFDIRNMELLHSESVFARRLGFDGKSALHPDQLTVINRIFDVSAEEISWAEKVIEELDGAEKRGKALSTLDGSLIDNPHRAAAQRILQKKDSKLQNQE